MKIQFYFVFENSGHFIPKATLWVRFSFIPHVFGGILAEVLFKAGCKMGCIAVACFKHYPIYIVMSLSEHMGRCLKPGVSQKFHRGKSRQVTHPSVELHTAQAHLPAQFLHVQGRI